MDPQLKRELHEAIEEASMRALLERLQSPDVRASDIEAARKLISDQREEVIETVVNESMSRRKPMPFQVLDVPLDPEEEETRNTG